MAHVLCMLDTKGYKHTLRICNAYHSSTVTVVKRKRIDVTLYVQCMSLSVHLGTFRSSFCTFSLKNT